MNPVSIAFWTLAISFVVITLISLFNTDQE